MREGDRGTTWSLPAYLLGQGALPLTHSALQILIGQLRPSPRLPAPTPQGDIRGKTVIYKYHGCSFISPPSAPVFG